MKKVFDKENRVKIQPKKVIKRDTANPNQTENVSKTLRSRILDNPYYPSASRSKERHGNLKAHQIDVERQRSIAILCFRRNRIR
jgi:hypothetical protein